MKLNVDRRTVNKYLSGFEKSKHRKKISIKHTDFSLPSSSVSVYG